MAGAWMRALWVLYIGKDLKVGTDSAYISCSHTICGSPPTIINIKLGIHKPGALLNNINPIHCSSEIELHTPGALFKPPNLSLSLLKPQLHLHIAMAPRQLSSLIPLKRMVSEIRQSEPQAPLPTQTGSKQAIHHQQPNQAVVDNPNAALDRLIPYTQVAVPPEPPLKGNNFDEFDWESEAGNYWVSEAGRSPGESDPHEGTANDEEESEEENSPGRESTVPGERDISKLRSARVIIPTSNLAGKTLRDSDIEWARYIYPSGAPRDVGGPELVDYITTKSPPASPPAPPHQVNMWAFGSVCKFEVVSL